MGHLVKALLNSLEISLRTVVHLLTCPAATAAYRSCELIVKHLSSMIIFLEILVFCSFHYSFWGTWKSLEYSPKNWRSTEKTEGRNGRTDKGCWESKRGRAPPSSAWAGSGETGGRQHDESKGDFDQNGSSPMLIPQIFDCKKESICILPLIDVQMQRKHFGREAHV